jgi:anti-sigma factor ChrR (cupin superfamily)
MQVRADLTRREVVFPAQESWLSSPIPGVVTGLTVLPLHELRGEHTALVRWEPGARFKPHTHVGGEEIRVLSGAFEDEDGVYPAGTWIRNPPMSRHAPFSTHGCTMLVKAGHLAMAAVA